MDESGPDVYSSPGPRRPSRAAVTDAGSSPPAAAAPAAAATSSLAPSLPPPPVVVGRYSGLIAANDSVYPHRPPARRRVAPCQGVK